MDLREIPAIIGGDQKSRHGVVLAKSPAAKRYGIRTGEPVANAFRKCPNLAMYPPDHRMYREKSRRLMAYLRTFTKEIEQVSVDECYMDFTGIADRYRSPVEGAARIKDGIRERFGFTVNIGISTNKLLAKMASDFEKPERIHTLYPEEIREKMWPLPIGDLYMAGRSSVEVLKKLEINTIGDLAQADPKLIMLHLKSHGKMLWEFANGIGRDVVQSEHQRLLRQLREAGAALSDPALQDKAARLEAVSARIFALAEADPGKEDQLRKFTSYYLPTALKLLHTYAQLDGQGVDGENITKTKQSIERSLDLLVTAFENQLDKLFQSDALDVSADIAALEGMLNLDGLSGANDFTPQ